MKLVIEVSEDFYENVMAIPKEDRLIAYDAIANGTPLTDCTDVVSRKAVLELSWELTNLDGSSDRVISVSDIKALSSVNPTTEIKSISTDNENNTCLKCSYFDDEFKSCAYPSMSVESMCPNELKNYNPTNMNIIAKIRAEIESKYAQAKQMRSVLQMIAYTDCLDIIDKYKEM